MSIHYHYTAFNWLIYSVENIFPDCLKITFFCGCHVTWCPSSGSTACGMCATHFTKAFSDE
jgi:hypothetical protein